MKFDDTTVSAYKNYGGLFSKVKAVDDPNEATRFFTFGLSKGTSQENADSYARFDLSSQEQVKNINFHVESIASNDNKGDIRNMISSQELKYSTAGTVNKFTASTTKGADELTYQENDPENHVLSFAQASPSEEWQEASTTYENAEEGYQQARKDLEKAQKRLDDIKNGESIDEDANAPSDDPGKTGLSMYAAKTEHVVNGEYYNLKSGSSITPNFLKAVMIPSITAREAGRRLRNVAYSGLGCSSSRTRFGTG